MAVSNIKQGAMLTLYQLILYNKGKFAEDDFCAIEHDEWGDFNRCKSHFLNGYSSIQTIPEFLQVMSLLQLNSGVAVI